MFLSFLYIDKIKTIKHLLNDMIYFDLSFYALFLSYW